MDAVTVAPLPHWSDAVVVVDPPGEGPGYWAGAPSALASNGDIYLAYRLRCPVDLGRGFANVVARSHDGVQFETIAIVKKEDFDSTSLERPALVRAPDGRWRLYVSCATPGTLHWRVDVLEADDPAAFDPSRRTTVLPGNEGTALKDPVLAWNDGAWHLWVCCHQVADPSEADRMHTLYATSDNGLDWTEHGIALEGREDSWDARGARITSVLLHGDNRVAYYDGRASAIQNWEEHTGVAIGNGRGTFRAQAGGPAAVSPFEGGGLRYLSVVPLPGGGHRLYYEATRPDGAHDLRSEYVPPTR